MEPNISISLTKQEINALQYLRNAFSGHDKTSSNPIIYALDNIISKICDEYQMFYFGTKEEIGISIKKNDNISTKDGLDIMSRIDKALQDGDKNEFMKLCEIYKQTKNNG